MNLRLAGHYINAYLIVGVLHDVPTWNAETRSFDGPAEPEPVPFHAEKHTFEYRDSENTEWVQLDPSKLAGTQWDTYEKGEHTLPVPPFSDWAEVIVTALETGERTVLKVERPYAPPGFDKTLWSYWQNDSYEAFANYCVQCPDVNGADENGDTLGHIIARSTHGSRYRVTRLSSRSGT